MISKKINPFIILMICSLAGCSFVEDRSSDPVQIVDASDSAATTPTVIAPVSKKPVQTKEYRVAKNDTLGIIAQKTMGSASLYRQLAQFNSLDPQEPLTIGQLLLIPQSFNGYQSSNIQPMKRPERAINTAVTTDEFKDLDKLIQQQNYNQAIDWALTHPEISNNHRLQAKLLEASQLQADKEVAEKDYSEALFLINGLINNGILTNDHNKELQLKSTQIQCQQLSHNALTKSQKKQIDPAYQDLLKAYQLNSEWSSSLQDFLMARESVTESMHQQALKLYRNQQLDSALTIWNKILLIKPNDDLALVYRDRVNSLKKRLEDI